MTGNIIDAHPNAIIANELDLFGAKTVLKGLPIVILAAIVCRQSRKWSETRNRRVKGYSLNFGKYHGKFENPLEVIGIRKSYKTVEHFMHDKELFLDNYKSLVVSLWSKSAESLKKP